MDPAFPIDAARHAHVGHARLADIAERLLEAADATRYTLVLEDGDATVTFIDRGVALVRHQNDLLTAMPVLEVFSRFGADAASVTGRMVQRVTEGETPAAVVAAYPDFFRPSATTAARSPRSTDRLP